MIAYEQPLPSRGLIFERLFPAPRRGGWELAAATATVVRSWMITFLTAWPLVLAFVSDCDKTTSADWSALQGGGRSRPVSSSTNTYSLQGENIVCLQEYISYLLVGFTAYRYNNNPTILTLDTEYSSSRVVFQPSIPGSTCHLLRLTAKYPYLCV